MRLILQRVRSASVEVGGELIASVDRGILVLVGIEEGDGPQEVVKAAEKLASLRIFEDEQGRMNFDCKSAHGAILLVSQFTLAASLAKGRRPSFDRAATAEVAAPLIEALAAGLRERGVVVATGQFGAYMQVRLINDGPVTFLLEIPARDSR